MGVVAQVPVALSYLESLLALPVPADGSCLDHCDGWCSCCGWWMLVGGNSRVGNGRLLRWLIAW